jgi:glycosyltransferase involved in cell wall biosynthesis
MAHGLHALLEAALLLRDTRRVKILLVGEGAEKEKLVEQARTLRLDNVSFVGQQPRESIPALLAATDANLVLLRRADLFTTTIPSKIFEIMGAARPMVLGVDGEARSIVEAAGAGVFVTPEDPAAIAAGVRQLMANPAQADEMGRRGRAYVAQHFSRDALADKYLELLSQVAR